MSLNVLLVGCGNMGYAMLKGWLAQNQEQAFFVIEPSEALGDRAAKAGAQVFADLNDLPNDHNFDFVFLAVKPQVMPQVVPAYAHFNACFVSIAAGVTIQSLAGWLGDNKALIRCMPNTPAAIGQGMMVSFENANTSETQKGQADTLLQASGETAWIDDEDLMDAVTAISGSGPAYVFHFIECLEQSAQKLGLPPEIAERLAMQTVFGAANLAKGSSTPPSTLREQVTSPGGTTAAALEVLRGNSELQNLMTKATTAARDRGVELGKA